METKYTVLISAKGKVGGYKSDLTLEQAKTIKKDMLDDNRNRQVPVTVKIIIGSYEF
jgi:hypothetical protein